MRKKVGETVLSAEDISSGLSEVAARLNANFDSAVVITVVPGGILVTADLVRQLDFDVAMDWISCPHTPGDVTMRRQSFITRMCPLRDEMSL